MAHAFKTIPGKPTFGTLKQVVYQGDYLQRKKALRTVCTSQANCGQIKNAKSYEQVNQYKEGFRLNAANRCNILPFNKSDLIVNLYSKMNLKDACTMINGFPCIDPGLSDVSCSDSTNPKCCSNACSSPKIITPGSTNPFNWNNTIDPLGNLFGNSQCGIQNYTQYMVFNPSNNKNNLVDISNSAAIGDVNSGNIDSALFAIQHQEMLRTSLFTINSATDESLASINSKMLDATSTIMDMTSNFSLALNEELLQALSNISQIKAEAINSINSALNGQQPNTNAQLTEINTLTTSSKTAINNELVKAMASIEIKKQDLISTLTSQINSKLLNATTNINEITAESIDSINSAFNGQESYTNEQLTEIRNNLLNKINYIFETFFHADAETIIANYPMAN